MSDIDINVIKGTVAERGDTLVLTCDSIIGAERREALRSHFEEYFVKLGIDVVFLDGISVGAVIKSDGNAKA